MSEEKPMTDQSKKIDQLFNYYQSHQATITLLICNIHNLRNDVDSILALFGKQIEESEYNKVRFHHIGTNLKDISNYLEERVKILNDIKSSSPPVEIFQD